MTLSVCHPLDSLDSFSESNQVHYGGGGGGPLKTSCQCLIPGLEASVGVCVCVGVGVCVSRGRRVCVCVCAHGSAASPAITS